MPAVRSSVARSVAPSSACAVPRSASAAGLQPLVGRELLEREVGVGERLLDAVGHHPRSQVGDPGLDRGASIRERDRRGRAVGESEPPLCLCRPSRQRSDPGSNDRKGGVSPQLVIAEPAQPLLQGLHTAVVVHRQCQGVDKAGDGIHLTRGVPVLDRRFGQVVRDAPVHRPAVECGHAIRLAALQLVAQQLAEQVVVAIPLALPVERHDEAVPVLQRLERVGGPRRLQHDVAKTAGSCGRARTCT